MAQEITAEKREAAGSANARRLRRAGKVPAVIYGHTGTSESLAVDGKELERALARGEHVVRLAVAGEAQPRQALFKEVQIHPTTSRLLHVDFAEISLTERVDVSVPVKLRGTARGIADGGVLDARSPEVRLSCLAAEIPADLRVDVSDLGLGALVHARDLALPANVTLSDEQDPEAVVVAVTAPRKEEPAPEAAATPSAVEPEVITARKEEEAAEEEAAAGAAPESGGKE